MYDDVRRAAKGEYELFCRAKAKEQHNWSRDVSVADGDELKAFKASYGRFEHLSRVYRAYIAIPASSAGAESLFSKAGGVACVTRASLAAPQIAMQVALQDNFHDSLLDVIGYSTERKKGGPWRPNPPPHTPLRRVYPGPLTGTRVDPGNYILPGAHPWQQLITASKPVSTYILIFYWKKNQFNSNSEHRLEASRTSFCRYWNEKNWNPMVPSLSRIIRMDIEKHQWPHHVLCKHSMLSISRSCRCLSIGQRKMCSPR